MADNDDKDGFERLSDRATRWGERQAGDLADSKHPVRKVVGVITVIVALLFVINIIGGFVKFGSDAIHETQRVLSVGNIKEQHTAIIQDWQDLLVAAGNACNAVSSPSSPNDPTLVEDPAFAYAATARRARTDYNRRQNNLFEAEKVGPSGYPRHVPKSRNMDKARPRWCAIADALHRTHE